MRGRRPSHSVVSPRMPFPDARNRTVRRVIGARYSSAFAVIREGWANFASIGTPRLESVA